MSNSGRAVVFNSNQTKIKIVDLEEVLKSVVGMDIGISVGELKKLNIFFLLIQKYSA